MKKLILQLVAVCATGVLLPAAAQNSPGEPPEGGGGPPMQAPDGGPPPPGAFIQAPDDGGSGQQGTALAPNQTAPAIHFIRPGANAGSTASQATVSSGSSSTTPVTYTPSASAEPANLRLNFDNVPLDEVLSYLSDAAGFIIVMDTQVHGTVSVISSHPLTRDEAVDLLNSVLNQNGYAAIRNGRTLTIVNKDDAKTRDIPVNTFNGDPDSIPKNDEIVTEIIPVRYVDASQLVSDLTSFVSPQATIVANQAGNSIVITDTQENIRHLVEIVSAIDLSAAGETEIRVFQLAYANPNDVATELGQIFPSGSSGNGLSPIAFRGPGGGGGGPGGFFRAMLANAAANSGNNRAQKQSQVTAVADARTQSVIVMASKDLMTEIAGMMQQLDVASPRDQKVYTVTLKHADPEEALQVLENTFPASSSHPSSSSSAQQEQSSLIQRQIQGATSVSQTSSSISSGTGTGLGRSGGGAGVP